MPIPGDESHVGLPVGGWLGRGSFRGNQRPRFARARAGRTSAPCHLRRHARDARAARVDGTGLLIAGAESPAPSRRLTERAPSVGATGAEPTGDAAWNRRHVLIQRTAAVVLALLGVVPTANLLTDGREVVWWRGAVLIWSAYGTLLLALLWIVADRWGDALDRLTACITGWVMRVPRAWFVAAVCAFTTVASIFVALYCYSGQAFTGDEMAMNWHARMLLAGHIAIPRPTHSEFFNTFGVMDRGPLWFSQFPIGGPALHAIGLAIGAPWLVNPLLLGLAASQMYRFTRRTFGEAAARAATLLFALSPFVLVLGSTQLGHTATLALTLTALAELAELAAWDDEEARSRALHATGLGLAIGSIALVRPYDAVLVAAPIGIFQLVRVHRSADHLRSLAIQCVAGAIPIAILLWANARTTGHPLLFAYDAAHGPAHGIGFHADPMGKLHSPRRGLVFTSGYLLRFNRFLFEWPVPAMVVVCAALATLRRATRWDTLLLGLVATFLLGYSAYWYPGFFDGPRFLFPIAPVLILAAARLPEAAARFTGTRRRVLRALVPACVLCAWLLPLGFTSVPGRLSALRAQRGKFKTDVAAEVRRAGLTNAVVFVPESWHERLTARLRALGVPQFDADRLVNTLDGCVLQSELDAADVATPADTAALRAQIIARATAAGRTLPMPGRLAETRIARAPGGPDTKRCREEAAGDMASIMPHAVFLREQRIDATGHLGGPVIFARDFGPRDTLLRAEFGTRTWYRYRPKWSIDDVATFEPIVQTATPTSPRRE